MIGGIVLFAGLICASASATTTSSDQVQESAKSTKQQEPIAIQLKQFKVTKGEGTEEKLGDASVVLPGDVIEYRAVYSNRGLKALPVVATLPIPDGTEYVKESADSQNKIPHTVAQKDSKFSTEPLIQKVNAVGDAKKPQPVPYSMYRYVRWDLGQLLPGSSVEVRARTKVISNQDGEAHVENKTTTDYSKN